MQEKLPGNAVLYVRVSTDKQAEEGTSLETQTEQGMAYADKHGYKVLKTFREEGETAKAWQRPVLLEMLKYLQDHKGKVHVLIVHKLDRLSRRTEDQYAIMTRLYQSQIELRSATENIDETPAGKLLRTVLWGVAEFDNAVRSERVRDGMHRRFREGYWPFGVPSGYVRKRNPETKKPELLPHPEYGSLVTWAAEQRAASRSYRWIARELRKREFKTSFGRPPNDQAVFHILHNSIYYGLMRAFNEEIMGQHEPLISHELFLRMRVVDGELAHPNPKRQTHNPEFPLVHTIRCKECGMVMRGSYSSGRFNVRYPYYHHHNPHCPIARSYKRKSVHEAFLKLLRDLRPQEEHLRLFRAVVLDVAKTKTEQQKEDARRLERKLEELRDKREKLIALKLQDPNHELLSRDEFLERKAKVEEEMEQTRMERTKFDVSEVSVTRFLDRCFAVLTDPAKRWETYTTAEDRLRFQQELFPQGVAFDGERCRTAEISPILAVFRDFPGSKQDLVGRAGFEPATRGI